MYTAHIHIYTHTYTHTHTHTHTSEDLPQDEAFRVRLRKSNSLMFSGPCQLEVLKDFDRNVFHIAILTDEEHRRLVVKWQIDHIRQYGSNNTAFKFQSGRSGYIELPCAPVLCLQMRTCTHTHAHAHTHTCTRTHTHHTHTHTQ